MLGEVVDALAEKRHLNFRGPGIAVVCLVRTDQIGLAVLAQRHWCFLHERPRNPFDLLRAPGSPYLGTRERRQGVRSALPA
jgi:hypothetical protein